ncbi:MAG: hypothetical protein HYT89_05770 [Candidatus Omnitrophica bacterium]|nr:hypothetical protein [Candidatus Omnitrophota bacterium]
MPEARRHRSVFSAFVILALLALIFFLSGGLLADGLASFLLSRQLGAPVECRQARFGSLREINFSSLKIYSEDKRPLLSSSDGGFFLGKQAIGLHLHRAVFHEAALGMFLAGGMGKWLEAAQKPPAVQDLRLLRGRKKKGGAVHFVAKGAGGAVYLRGGVRFAAGHLLKGHALVRVPERWLEGIPEAIRPGETKQGGDWSEFKVFAGENSFRVMGENGPLLEAGWR